MLQGKENKKLTIPRIETPSIDSERYAPSIGQLIAERLKYGIKELNIVKIDNIDQSSATEDRVRMEMKLLIQKMTIAHFKDRIPLSEVLLALQTIEGFLLESKIEKRKKRAPQQKALSKMPEIKIEPEVNDESQAMETEQEESEYEESRNGEDDSEGGDSDSEVEESEQEESEEELDEDSTPRRTTLHYM